MKVRSSFRSPVISPVNRSQNRTLNKSPLGENDPNLYEIRGKRERDTGYQKIYSFDPLDKTLLAERKKKKKAENTTI